MRRSTPLLLSAVALAACSPSMATDPGPIAAAASRSASPSAAAVVGAVYTTSNDAATNAVVVYDRASDGSLTYAASIPTGGRGAGAGLGSQNAIVGSSGGEWLYAVNAGSNEVSLLRMAGAQTTLMSTVSSGGDHPVSVTERYGIVYVLNGGQNNNIAGFRHMSVGGTRTLVPIPGSVIPLSAPNAGGAQIQFTPRGDALIVTEKATNSILTFPLVASWRAGAPIITASAGQTPFGFTFAGPASDVLVVSEAFGGAPNASTASSYRVGGNGALSLVTASLANGQTAACWFAATKDGRVTYAANTGSADITRYRVTDAGALQLVDNNQQTPTGMTPTDVAVTADGRFFYSLATGAGEIRGFSISLGGGLGAVDTQTGVATTTVGLVAR